MYLFSFLAIICVLVGYGLVKFNVAGGIAGIFLILCGAFFILIVFMGGIAAYQDQKFIARHFNQSYSMDELFWNSESIKTMLIGEKIRLDKE